MKKKRIRWLLPLLVLTLIFSLGVAACDDDDDEDEVEDAIEGAATEVTEGVEGAATEVDEAAEDAEDALEGAATEVDEAAEDAEDAVEGAATEVDEAADEAGDEIIAASEGLTGDAANGETLFTSLGCTGCHAVEGDAEGAGPSLANIGAEAGERVEGMSAEEYLRESIIHPNAHVVEGFQPDIMPSYADQVDGQQLADLVAYLMTLGA